MEITHDTDGNRFVSRLDGGEAELAYMERDGKVLDLIHTYVPAAARGEGIGESLVEHAFDFAEENGYRVIPSCPFVRAWLQEHPERQSVVARGG